MDDQREGKSSRRQFIKGTAAATAFTLTPDITADARTKTESERIEPQERGKQFIADSQTHIFWRREGHVKHERAWLVVPQPT